MINVVRPRTMPAARVAIAAAAISVVVALVGAAPRVAAADRAAGVVQTHAQPDTPAAHGEANEGDATETEHGGGIVLPMVAKLVNFAILAATLVYFLRSPLAEYLSNRGSQIRSDLVKASDMRAAATEQLAAIDRRLAALPGELEALKAQGVQEIASEEARIHAAAETERLRLLEQTRREIDVHLRVAKRELVEHTADLAIKIASERVKRTIGEDDQRRLVDRYLETVSHKS